MNKSAVQDLSVKLAKLYLAKAELDLREWQLSQDLNDRELALAPLEGWDGKNAEQRDLAKARKVAGDPYSAKLRRELYQAKSTLALTAGQIQSLEAERRGQEWRIREMLVRALGGVAPNEMDEAAFDQAGDEAIFDDETPAVPMPEMPPEEAEILFEIPTGTPPEEAEILFEIPTGTPPEEAEILTRLGFEI